MPFAETSDLQAISVTVGSPGFWGGQIVRVVLEQAAVSPQLSPLIAGTEPFTTEWITHYHSLGEPKPPRDIACTFATDAVVTGNGEIWLNDRLISDVSILPNYVYGHILGLPERGEELMTVHRRPLRNINAPCVVMPGGSAVFGHFLIETMFYVVTVQRMLRSTGLQAKWLVPSTAAPWHSRMLVEDLGIPATDLITYDPNAERLRLRYAILPAVIHREDGFHPIAANMVDELLRRLVPDKPEAPVARIFVTRLGLTDASSSRECANEASLVAHAVKTHGFKAVSMQTLPWRRQVALMRQAEIVVGPFGSAMHNTIFAPSGTRVGCIGLSNMVQSEIGALRGHRMAYLTEGFKMEGQYVVDESQFIDFLAAVCR